MSPTVPAASIGPYLVLRPLGEGGMGTVYEAVHESIERRVAIKVLKSQFARDPDIAARFFNEARAVNIVEHPAIVQISDYGQLPDGTAYLVMEYLRGETLGQRMKHTAGRMPLLDVLRIARQVATALAAAHEKGVIHRDLKQDNLMLIPDPDIDLVGRERIKILYFGIAKVAREAVRGQNVQTQAGILIGTPFYMSPEQCRGAASVDDKTDVYALGIILYELISDRVPFDRVEAGATMAAHIYEEPQPLRALSSTVPTELAALVHRMLTKDRLQRPSMKETATELERQYIQYRSGPQSAVSANPASASAATPGLDGASQSARSLGKLDTLAADGAPAALSRDLSSEAAAERVNVVSVSPPSPSRPQMRRNMPLAVVVLSLCIGASWVVVRTSGPKTKPTPTAPPSLPTAAPVIAAALPRSDAARAADPILTVGRLPPAPPLPKSVRWSVDTQPPPAQVLAKDTSKVLGTTPWRSEQPSSPQKLIVLLRLAGYEPREVVLDGSADAVVSAQLTRQAGPERKQVTPKRKRRRNQPAEVAIEIAN